MLDDRHRRARRELGDQLDRTVGVVDVVVGERLALELARRRHSCPRLAATVETGALVRVLAVAECLAQLATKGAPRRHRLTDCGSHPVRDRRIVDGGPCERLLRKAPAEGEDGAAGRHGREDLRIVVGIDHNRDVGMVLGGAADHCRAADVNILDGGGVIATGRDRRLERVEVHDEQVDRLDIMRQHRRFVFRVFADRKQTAVDLGMQGFQAAIHHLGKAGEIGDLGDGEPGLAQRAVRSAGRDQRHAMRRQSLGERDKTRLVGHRDERARDRFLVRGHEWSCQTACVHRGRRQPP